MSDHLHLILVFWFSQGNGITAVKNNLDQMWWSETWIISEKCCNRNKLYSILPSPLVEFSPEPISLFSRVKSINHPFISHKSLLKSSYFSNIQTLDNAVVCRDECAFIACKNERYTAMGQCVKSTWCSQYQSKLFCH